MAEPGCIGAVILAAGSSSRLGLPKQLVDVNGRPLLLRVADAVRAGVDGPVVVVLGANADAIGGILAGTDVATARNPNWENGMGSSIATGVNYLLQGSHHLAGILVSVCDQPLLEAGHIQKLVSMGRRHPGSIVASHYAGTHGPPALFPPALHLELAELSGSRGARHLFVKHASKLVSFPFPEGEFDIDTARDYQKLTNPNPRNPPDGH